MKSFIYKCLVKLSRIVRKIPILDILYINFYALCRGNKIIKLKPKTFKALCEEKGFEFYIIEDKQERMVYEPSFYNMRKGEKHYYKSPNIYVSILKNVIVHGGSGIIISDENAITDVCENDIDNRRNYSAGTILRGTKHCFYVEASKDIIELNENVINLCGVAANNYFHLTVEILSRYGYLRDYLKEKEWSILLDEASQEHRQYIELIETIVGGIKKIIVPKGKRILCKCVLYPSINIWLPFNIRKKNDFQLSDNVLALSAVQNIRNATSSIREKEKGRKIFISRKNTVLSRIENEQQVIELFKQAGFDIICTENLSFEEQVRLFSSASCVAGASGAAMTNIIYCNPGTILACIIPQKYNFCIYSSIAHMLECKTLYLDAEVSHKGTTISDDVCRVDIDNCRLWIEYLNKLCK